MRKYKPFLHILLFFLWKSVHQNTLCYGNKVVGSEEYFEETEDQLSPRHFEYKKILLLSKIEKVPRSIRGEKSSKEMASSRNLVSTIGLRWIHHFKSDLIYNMDPMRISGTEPSSVTLS